VSDATKAALDIAVEAHIADVTAGGMVTDYALVTASTDMEDIGTGATTYFYEGNNHQPAHVSYGLLSYALNSVIWDEDEDDE